jgi:predicted alpha/beta superfamily hydrolase
MKQLPFTLLLFCWLFLGGAAQAQINTAQQAVLPLGEQLRFYSAILQEERVLNVYLPQGYHKDSNITYPIVFLLDGGREEDFVHISGLVQFANFPWVNLLEPSIVVGVANLDRERDFTFPSSNADDQRIFPSSGHSANFINFLQKEVKPLVARTYTTDSTTTLIGQSLGGLLATEILLKHPDMFHNYLIVSPSLWWDDRSLLQHTTADLSKVHRIFIAAGAAEEAFMREDAQALFEKLTSILPRKTHIHFRLLENRTHADVLHTAIYQAFEWMQKTTEGK